MVFSAFSSALFHLSRKQEVWAALRAWCTGALVSVGHGEARGVAIRGRPGGGLESGFLPRELGTFCLKTDCRMGGAGQLSSCQGVARLGVLLPHVGSLKESCGSGWKCVAVTLRSFCLDLTGDVTAVSIPVCHVVGLLWRDSAYLL